MGKLLVTSNALLGCLLLSAAPPARPAASPGQEKPSVVTLVPPPDWQMTGSQTEKVSALAGWGGDPAIEKEYGVTAYAGRSYQFEDRTAKALLEQASDPSAAYGLLTFYRSDGMKPIEGMAESVFGADQALLARGPVFIRISLAQPGGMNESEWRRLALVVGGPPPSRHALEQLPQPLPSPGLVKGSEKYLLGPVAAQRVLPGFRASLLGFQDGAEVQTAQYAAAKNGKLTLAAIEYPTPQLARAGLKTIDGALAVHAAAQPPVECRRQDTYVLVVLNAPSSEAAKRFLDGFNVKKEIDVDQASGPSDVWQLVQLLIANGELIIFLVISSLIGGIIVCVAKRLARKWFANTIFVEGEGGGIIVLNLKC